jgi:hypothetical protein
VSSGTNDREDPISDESSSPVDDDDAETAGEGGGENSDGSAECEKENSGEGEYEIDRTREHEQMYNAEDGEIVDDEDETVESAPPVVSRKSTDNQSKRGKTCQMLITY